MAKKEKTVKKEDFFKREKKFRPHDVVMAEMKSPRGTPIEFKNAAGQYVYISARYKKGFNYRLLRPPELGLQCETLFKELVEHENELPESVKTALDSYLEAIK